MNIGIIVLVVIGVMTFSQIVMLARAQKRRYEDLVGRSARLERQQPN